MNCPICKGELEIKKKKAGVNENGEAIYAEFAICHNCKKQWNLDKQRAKAKKSSSKTASTKTSDQTSAKRRRPAQSEEPVTRKRRPANAEDTTTTKKKRKRTVEVAPEHVSQYYSNIPPESVRKKREKEMKENYDKLLDQAGPGDADYERGAYGGTILLVILLIAIIALGVYIYFRFF